MGKLQALHLCSTATPSPGRCGGGSSTLPSALRRSRRSSRPTTGNSLRSSAPSIGQMPTQSLHNNLSQTTSRRFYT